MSKPKKARVKKPPQNYLTLKWGTIKACNFEGIKEATKLLRRYFRLNHSFSAAMQDDTPEQKEIICQLIDLTPGRIFLEWTGKSVSHEQAKRYVRNYGKEAHNSK